MVFLSADRLNCGSPRETNSVEGILTQVEGWFQVEKLRRVGGPFAALSGGMSDVRSLWNKAILAPAVPNGKITKVCWEADFR